jgi:hypothetical protein
MTTRRIIADLASMPVAEIEAELDGVRSERRAVGSKLDSLQAQDAKLEMEEQLLAQMLRLRQWKADGVPGAAQAVAAAEASAPQRKAENLSANVLAVVRQARQPVLPADVRDRLAADGVNADLNAIRVALRRWAERGQLVKHDRFYVDGSASTLLSPANHQGSP